MRDLGISTSNLMKWEYLVDKVGKYTLLKFAWNYKQNYKPSGRQTEWTWRRGLGGCYTPSIFELFNEYVHRRWLYGVQ